jgi:hypothetical protein
MREVNGVFISFKGMRESQCVIEPLKLHVFPGKVVLKIADVSARPVPTKLIFFSLKRRVAQDTHAFIV